MNKDHKTIWNNCLEFIKENVGEQSFNTWFAPIKPLRLENKVLTIQVPSQFFYEWLEEHYVYLLRKAIDKEIGKDSRLEYSVIVDKGNKSDKPLSINLPTNTNTGTKNNGETQYNKNTQKGRTSKNKEREEQYRGPFVYNKDVDTEHVDSQLSTHYNFDSFVEGDCNRLARSAGFAVANKPGVTSFNPLMIYGGVGLGKTHLVQAIGNEIKRNIDNKFILYVSSEKFTNQFIEALKYHNVQKFSNFYLQVDTLILDDVQFLSGKEKTQEIFFHIFNHLHQSGKQIIMTSDSAPRNLKGLQERLLSRFKWGLTADLQAPDFETRVAIIQKKAQADGVVIPDEVIEYLAYSVDTNIRELEGVLISLIAQASLNRKDIDLDLAKQTLSNIVHDVETEVSIDYIQKTVAEFYGVSQEMLKSKTRKKEVVLARQAAMYLAKEYTKFSLKAIGYHFGGRDHSTVIHAVQNISDAKDTNSQTKQQIEDLTHRLKIRRNKS